MKNWIRSHNITFHLYNRNNFLCYTTNYCGALWMHLLWVNILYCHCEYYNKQKPQFKIELRSQKGEMPCPATMEESKRKKEDFLPDKSSSMRGYHSKSVKSHYTLWTLNFPRGLFSAPLNPNFLLPSLKEFSSPYYEGIYMWFALVADSKRQFFADLE